MKKGYLLALSSLYLCGGILATTGSADAAVKWGDYHKDGHYVTIMKKGYGFYKDKDFKKKATTSDKLYHKTYLAKGYYNLSDGRRYMSLYDHNKKWVGYVRSSAVKTAKTAGGIAFNTDKKVKVTKKDYRIWKDLNFKEKKGTTNSYYKKTLYVKPHYNHFNQNVYYSLYTKEPFSKVVHIGLLATSFSPIVTELMFVIDVNPALRLILALVVGISVGFIITPVSRHLFNTHKGYNLYNVGFSIGLLSTLYVSVMKSYGLFFYQRLVLSSGNNVILSVFLLTFFFLTFLYGAYLNKFNFKSLLLLFKETGYKDNDFVVKYGVGTSLMNMAINGFLALFYVIVIAKGELNGPSIGGILAVYGFGGLGKHWRNIIPIFIGVFLGSLTKSWNLNDTSSLFAALFGTALAPVAGEFGFIAGVIISLINSSVVLNSGLLHGGMNLYNTGFSVGLVAAVVVPFLEMIRSKRKDKL